MDKLFAQFLYLYALGYEVQSNYMYCDGWSRHSRVSLMKLSEVRNDFKYGRIRIDPQSCEEAAKLWDNFPKHLMDSPLRRDVSKMDVSQLKAYSLYLCDFADAKDSHAYQKICDEGLGILEGIRAKEKIVFGE